MTCNGFEIAHLVRTLFTCSVVKLIKESPDICTWQNPLLHAAQTMVITYEKKKEVWSGSVEQKAKK